LAAAALSGQAQDLAAFQPHADIAERVYRAALGVVLHLQVLDVEHGARRRGARAVPCCLGQSHAEAFPDLGRCTPRLFVPARRRGLAISSMPKLMKASPAPSTAMQRPGATNHHHAPSSSASLLAAQ